MQRVLISGSISYDTLLQVDVDFRDTLRGSTDSLSVGYHCHAMHHTYGGNAANIAFHLTRLGLSAVPVAAVGSDFDEYGHWMDENGVQRSLLLHIDTEPTAQVYILSDAQENQILALYLGAMRYSRDITLGTERADLAVVGPDDRDALLQRIADFKRLDIPVMLDPGQSITSLSGNDISNALRDSRWLIANEFECSLIASLTGKSAMQLATNLDALIVTRGAKGSRIFHDRVVTDVDAVPPVAVLDPTGCGDSFRAGLIAAMLQGQSIEDAARQGAALASETLSHIGAQWQE